MGHRQLLPDGDSVNLSRAVATEGQEQTLGHPIRGGSVTGVRTRARPVSGRRRRRRQDSGRSGSRRTQDRTARRQPGAPGGADAGGCEHRVRTGQRQQAWRAPGSRRCRGPTQAAGARRHRRHRDRLRKSRWRSSFRNVLRRAVEHIRPAGRPLGHRFRSDRTPRRVARHRCGALRDVLGALPYRSHDGHAGAPADRCRLGDRRRAGRLGGPDRVLRPVALRHGRIHRLLPFRGGDPGTRPTVRLRGSGGGGPQGPRRAVARTSAQPADLSDLRMPGWAGAHLPALTAAVARHVGLAGRAGPVLGPRVRHHRGPLRRRGGSQHRHRGALRATHQSRPGRRGPGPGGAHRRGPHAARGAGGRALPRGRSPDRRRTGRGRDADGPGRSVGRRRRAPRLRPLRPGTGCRRTGLGASRRFRRRRGLRSRRGRSRVCASSTSG